MIFFTIKCTLAKFKELRTEAMAQMVRVSAWKMKTVLVTSRFHRATAFLVSWSFHYLQSQQCSISFSSDFGFLPYIISLTQIVPSTGTLVIGFTQIVLRNHSTSISLI
jgi:ribosome-associated toxin RatA of RatAB toxin-antitoxin module